MHKLVSEIPNYDTDGKELSYTHVEKSNQKDWDTELLPLKDDEISLLRHAASSGAMSEILLRHPDVDLNTDFLEDGEYDIDTDKHEYDENESFESVTSEISLKFSPEDFVTRTDEEEQEQMDFLESLLKADNLGKGILHVIANTPKEYLEPAKIIRLLCENGADINMRDIDGTTPVISFMKSHASLSGSKEYSTETLEILCEFIRVGANLDLKDERGFSFPKFLNDEDYTNDEKFKYNICYGTDYVKMLVFMDILNTIIESTNSKNSNLFIASFGHDVKKISKALSNGADIETRTKKGYTPLMIASMFGTPETVKLLLENGANINAQDKFGNNLIALNVVAGEPNNANIFALVEAGVNVNSQNNEGLTPLIQSITEYSRYGDKLSKVKTLLSVGAEPDITTNDGESVITIAAKNGKYKAVKELLLAGVEPEKLFSMRI